MKALVVIDTLNDFVTGVLANEADAIKIVPAILRLVDHARRNPDWLALLWHFRLDGVGEEFLTVRTSPGWRPCEEVEDGLPDGRHAWLWRRSPDSFFSVPLL